MLIYQGNLRITSGSAATTGGLWKRSGLQWCVHRRQRIGEYDLPRQRDGHGAFLPSLRRRGLVTIPAPQLLDSNELPRYDSPACQRDVFLYFAACLWHIC